MGKWHRRCLSCTISHLKADLSQPGGQDSQLVDPETGHVFVDTSYLLQSDDQPPAHIAIKTSGWRSGSKEVMARLADPKTANSVDPNEYTFRLFIKLETGDERYKQVNTGMWIGSAARYGSEGEHSVKLKPCTDILVIYDAYRIG